MQIRETATEEWSRVRQNLVTERGETGQQFVKAVEFWADTTERLVREPDSEMTLIHAYRTAFQILNTELGYVDDHFIGQIMIAHMTFWELSDQVILNLSSIESRFLQNSLAERQRLMQEMAETAVQTGDSGTSD